MILVGVGLGLKRVLPDWVEGTCCVVTVLWKWLFKKKNELLGNMKMNI